MVGVFVTGATGQVGSAVVEYLLTHRDILLESPAEIYCLVRNLPKAEFLRQKGVTLVSGDLGNRQVMLETLQKHPIKYVFHVAANIDVNAGYEEMYKSNVEGTRNMLEAFVNSPAEIFVQTSSIIVYDHSPYRKPLVRYEFTEESEIGSTNRDEDLPYAVTKRLAEQLVHKYLDDLPTKCYYIFRLGAVIGPRDSLMLPMLSQAFPLPLPKLINHGTGALSIVSSPEIAHTQVYFAAHGDAYKNQTFNLVQRICNFRQLFAVIAEYYKKSPPKWSVPLWAFQVAKPLLLLLRAVFRRAEFLQIITSHSAFEYLQYSYIYRADKLLATGFEFETTVKEAMLEGLRLMDLEKDVVLKGDEQKAVGHTDVLPEKGEEVKSH